MYTLARAQVLQCSTRQAVGRRRSGSRFCSPSDLSSQKDGDMKAVYTDRSANDEATGKIFLCYALLLHKRDFQRSEACLSSQQSGGANVNYLLADSSH